MSLKVCGAVFGSMKDVDANELSYKLVVAASSEKIGIVMGGNVNEKVYSRYLEDLPPHLIAFELLSCPLDNNAEELFSLCCLPPEKLAQGFPDKNSITLDLCSRMDRVQRFLITVLQCDGVSGIYLGVNYLFEDDNEAIRNICADSFSAEMVSIIMGEGCCDPVVKLIIS